jgi:hypothetical protein
LRALWICPRVKPSKFLSVSNGHGSFDKAPISMPKLYGQRLVQASFCCHYGWYNTRRIQKELGYLSPDEYETAWHDPAEPDNLAPAPTGSR